MAAKLVRMLTKLWGLLLIMLLDSLVMCSWEIKWQIKFIISPLPRCLSPLNPAGLTMRDSQPWSHVPFPLVVLKNHVANYRRYISTTIMTTDFGRMVSYLERLLLRKSYDHIITWSCKIMWQIKIIIYPVPQSLWLYKESRPFDHVVLQNHVTN